MEENVNIMKNSIISVKEVTPTDNNSSTNHSKRTHCNISDMTAKNASFEVLHTNIRSLRNKTDNIELETIANSNIKAICLTETMLNSEILNGENGIRDFNVFRRDRNQFGAELPFVRITVSTLQ